MLIAFVYVGIMGIFYNKLSVKLTERFFSFLYRKTNLYLFKKIVAEATKYYMNILFFAFGIIGFILGINFIIQSIFGIGLPISY